jgi:hypothetical protein
MRAHLFRRLPSVYGVVIPVVIGLDAVSFHVIVGTEGCTIAQYHYFWAFLICNTCEIRHRR